MLWNGSGILKAKYYGELAVREEFPEAVVLRPSIVYGLEDRWLMWVLIPCKINLTLTVFLTSHCSFFNCRRHAHFLRRGSDHFPLYKKGFGITKMPVSVNDIATAIYEIVKNPDSAGQTYQAVGYVSHFNIILLNCVCYISSWCSYENFIFNLCFYDRPNRYYLHDLMLWIMNEMRMGEDDGFKISDFRFTPVQIAKVLAFEMLPGKPIGSLTREIMELVGFVSHSGNCFSS